MSFDRQWRPCAIGFLALVALLTLGVATVDAGGDDLPLDGPMDIDPTGLEGSVAEFSPVVVSHGNSTWFFWLERDTRGTGGPLLGEHWQFGSVNASAVEPHSVSAAPLGDQTEITPCLGSNGSGAVFVVESSAMGDLVTVGHLDASSATVGPLEVLLDGYDRVSDIQVLCGEAGVLGLTLVADDLLGTHLLFMGLSNGSWVQYPDLVSWSSASAIELFEIATTANGTQGTVSFATWEQATANVSLFECSDLGCNYENSFVMNSLETPLAFSRINSSTLLMVLRDASTGREAVRLVNVTTGQGLLLDMGLSQPAGYVLSAALMRLSPNSIEIITSVRTNGTNAELFQCSFAPSTSSFGGLATLESVSRPDYITGGETTVVQGGTYVAFGWSLESITRAVVRLGWYDPARPSEDVFHNAPQPRTLPTAKRGLSELVLNGTTGLYGTLETSSGSILITRFDPEAGAAVVARWPVCGLPTQCSVPVMVGNDVAQFVFWAAYGPGGTDRNHTLFYVHTLADGSWSGVGVLANATFEARIVGPAAIMDGQDILVAWLPDPGSSTSLRIMRITIGPSISLQTWGYLIRSEPIESFRLGYDNRTDRIIVAWAETNLSVLTNQYEFWIGTGSGSSPSFQLDEVRLAGRYARSIGDRFEIASGSRGFRILLAQPLGSDVAPYDSPTLRTFAGDGSAPSIMGIPCVSGIPVGSTRRMEWVSVFSTGWNTTVGWVEGIDAPNRQLALVVGRFAEGEGWSCGALNLTGSFSDRASWLRVRTDSGRISAVLLLANEASEWQTRIVLYLANRVPTQPVLVSPTNNSRHQGPPDLFSWMAAIDPDGDSIEYEVAIDDCAGRSPLKLATTSTWLNLSGFLGFGSFCWRVGATDGWSVTWSEQGVFHVDADWPVVEMSFPPSVLEGSEVEFEALVSASNATPVTYEFDLDGIDGFEISGGESLVRRTYLEQGSFVVAVRITDALGRISTTNGRLLVLNAPPSLMINGPLSADEGTEISLEAVAVDPSPNDTIGITWYFEGEFGAVGSTISVELGLAGVLHVLAIAVDDDGGIATATTNVTILRVNPMAVLVGPSSPRSGSTGYYQVGAEHPILPSGSFNRQWTVDGLPVGETPVLQWAFSAPGDHLVAVVVSDDEGRSSNASLHVVVRGSLSTIELREVENSWRYASFFFTILGEETPPESVEVVIDSVGPPGGRWTINLTAGLVGSFEIPYSLAGSSFNVEVQARWADGSTIVSNRLDVTKPTVEDVDTGTDLWWIAWLILGLVLGGVAVLVVLRLGRRTHP